MRNKANFAFFGLKMGDHEENQTQSKPILQGWMAGGLALGWAS